MKSIVYTAVDGSTAIVRPVPWARMCKSALVDGKTQKYDPPVPFDTIMRQGSAELIAKMQPEWAEGDDEFIERVKKISVPADATNVSVIYTASIPADRTFRDALRHDLTHDMGQARDIHRGRMRHARASKLSTLDAEYMRADEAGDTKAKSSIAKRKQALRDVTKHPDIDGADTVEKLKAVWPEVLA